MKNDKQMSKAHFETLRLEGVGINREARGTLNY